MASSGGGRPLGPPPPWLNGEEDLLDVSSVHQTETTHCDPTEDIFSVFDSAPMTVTPNSVVQPTPTSDPFDSFHAPPPAGVTFRSPPVAGVSFARPANADASFESSQGASSRGSCSSGASSDINQLAARTSELQADLASREREFQQAAAAQQRRQAELDEFKQVDLTSGTRSAHALLVLRQHLIISITTLLAITPWWKSALI